MQRDGKVGVLEGNDLKRGDEVPQDCFIAGRAALTHAERRLGEGQAGGAGEVGRAPGKALRDLRRLMMQMQAFAPRGNRKATL